MRIHFTPPKQYQSIFHNNLHIFYYLTMTIREKYIYIFQQEFLIVGENGEFRSHRAWCHFAPAGTNTGPSPVPLCDCHDCYPVLV